jgi:hypothetical protein
MIHRRPSRRPAASTLLAPPPTEILSGFALGQAIPLLTRLALGLGCAGICPLSQPGEASGGDREADAQAEGRNHEVLLIAP